MGVGGRESASVVLRLTVGLVRMDEVCKAGLHDATGSVGGRIDPIPEDRVMDGRREGRGVFVMCKCRPVHGRVTHCQLSHILRRRF